MFQGYEGSLLKVTSKNGKTASVSRYRLIDDTIYYYYDVYFSVLKNALVVFNIYKIILYIYRFACEVTRYCQCTLFFYALEETER